MSQSWLRANVFGCFVAVAFVAVGCRSQSTTNNFQSDIQSDEAAMAYLHEIAGKRGGIGPREAGSRGERRTGDWIENKLESFGYEVVVQPFEYVEFGYGDPVGTSRNYIAEKKGLQDKTIVIAAHYDSVGVGSRGAIDNGTGVAATMAIAQNLQDVQTPFNVRFVLVGAEEVGLTGSQYYVQTAQASGGLDDVIGMINLDSVAGGDFVYVNSAFAYSPDEYYTSESMGIEGAAYNTKTVVRDRLLFLSANMDGQSPYQAPPPYEELSQFRNAAVSDFFSFACAGIPIASVESTNYGISGIRGADGYSQTTNPAVWDCYDAELKTSCDPIGETKWGELWHSEFDTLETLESFFPGRIEQQLTNTVAIVTEFLTDDADWVAEIPQE